MLKPLIALYFFILAAIQLGLLIGLFHYHRSRNLVRPSPYWMGSLIANISALFVFGLGDRKSTRLNSSHSQQSRMPSSA